MYKVSKAVYTAYYTGKRKMKYYEKDLKFENIVANQEKATIAFIPSREDSYERLIEVGKQFIDDEPDTEEKVIKNILLEKLHNDLLLLSEDEFKLIKTLYFDEKSERQWAEESGIPQKTINNRKRKILRKLKKLMEK